MDYLLTACEVNADIVFVLDVSRSIGIPENRFNETAGDENFKKVTDFVSKVPEMLPIGLQNNLVGVILFAREAVVRFDVMKHKTRDELVTAVNKIVYSKLKEPDHNGTNTPEALDLLQDTSQLKLRGSNYSKIVVFITDGRTHTRRFTSNTEIDDAINTQHAAERLHDAKIYDQIYAIGIEGKNSTINKTQLGIIASDPSLVFNVSGFTDELFNDLSNNFARRVCKRKPGYN